MSTLATVVGIGIFMFILLYISFNLDKEHTLWKIFTILLVIFSLSILTKASIDNYSCGTFLVNTTTHVSGDVVYSYEHICPLQDSSTVTSFLRLNDIVLRVFTIYFLLFTLYYVANKFLNLSELAGRIIRKR